jgi:hypothetical protein
MNHLSRWTIFLAATLFLAACAQFVSTLDSGYYEEMSANGATQGSLIFSHNINGETEPCGCRKFPLGGLEQAAGHFHQERNKGPVVYVDTGDLFFPSPVLPENVHRSLGHTGEKLAEAMDLLGLKFFVPGDQDFALGIDWLNKVSQKAKFTFLLANLKDPQTIKSKKWARLIVGQKSFVFIGVLDPDLLSGANSTYFSAPEEAIAASLKDSSPNSSEIVVLLSHSGMDTDIRYAEKFPRINWIVGAHSQSYTQRPTEQGKTQLMQVLSRNHFLGQMKFGLGKQDEKTEFGLLETREEIAELVKPNPMTPLIKSWKEGLVKIQNEEQKTASGTWAQVDPLPTFNSCLECHQKQTEFWQSTSHANAWHTLMAKQSDNDSSCVGCHSAGWQHPQGFMATPARVKMGEEAGPDALKKYTEALSKNYAGIKSVRALNALQRKKLAQGQMKLINQFKVTHEYGNVQCINCHDKKRDHPFDGSTTHDGSNMANRCLSCHTSDQSPEWYQNNKPNNALVAQKIKSVACPKK